MKTKELKVGDKIRINDKPCRWSSNEDDARFPLNLNYPVTGIVTYREEEEADDNYVYVTVTIDDVKYGFDETTLLLSCEVLDEQPKTFPRKMLVGDTIDKLQERIVITKLDYNVDYPYIAVDSEHEDNYNEGKRFSTYQWVIGKELPTVNKEKEDLLKKADELIEKANELKQQAERM